MGNGKRDFMTLAKAAELVNVTPGALRAAINKGLLIAEKHGRDWLVTKEALNAWKNKQIHKSGRPRKSTD